MKTDNTETSRIQVAVVDSDPLQLAGFRALLDSYDDLRLTSLSFSELDNLRDIDVILLAKRPDHPLSGSLQRMKTVRPDVPVIVIGMGANYESILEALVNGAKGYVDEAAALTDLVTAIRTVHKGVLWASRKVMAMFVSRYSDAGKRLVGRVEFTVREKQVLGMIVSAQSNKEIAVRLGIEVRTVKAHVAKLLRKVGAQNRVMLSVHAIRTSLLDAH